LAIQQTASLARQELKIWAHSLFRKCERIACEVVGALADTGDWRPIIPGARAETLTRFEFDKPSEFCDGEADET
jgi:hypothetical protein